MGIKSRGFTASSRKTASRRKRRFLTVDRVIIGGSLLVMLAILGYAVYRTLENRSINRDIEGVEVITNLTRDHSTTPVTYAQLPPAGGVHHPAWQTCGVYTEPIKNEHAVHSLEHGVVWITYQPDLDEDEVEKLQDITRRGSHRLLSPYPGIDSPIILTAWGYQLRLDSVDDDRLMDFIRKYEQGPTTPELGATCSGGETRTLAQLQQG